MRTPGTWFIALVLLLMPPLATASHAGSFTTGSAAYGRGDYVRAANILLPLAERGHPRAQTLIGFMFATGRGVPQSYQAASYWYHLSAEQGDVQAQALLGLMYDKGHGVPLDTVLAYKWLNLAAAAAPKRERDYYERLRNAVASKMTRWQIAEGQALALAFVPRRPPF
ncbi:MAG TPA: tetratricopeptide repeat protein [Xanthobacteraceae bacterium]|nr:tetratricopeptide repeat protein [Xanthobacteraceae bacterium]